MKRYEVENYTTARGNAPFAEWLKDLTDTRAQTSIIARLDRASNGNFGDWKKLDKDLFEMRIDYGPGYRVYYSIVEQRVILLLAGSTKRNQNRMIAKASEYLADYIRRTEP